MTAAHAWADGDPASDVLAGPPLFVAGAVILAAAWLGSLRARPCGSA